MSAESWVVGQEQILKNQPNMLPDNTWVQYMWRLCQGLGVDDATATGTLEDLIALLVIHNKTEEAEVLRELQNEREAVRDAHAANKSVISKLRREVNTITHQQRQMEQDRAKVACEYDEALEQQEIKLRTAATATSVLQRTVQTYVGRMEALELRAREAEVTVETQHNLIQQMQQEAATTQTEQAETKQTIERLQACLARLEYERGLDKQQIHAAEREVQKLQETLALITEEQRASEQNWELQQQISSAVQEELLHERDRLAQELHDNQDARKISIASSPSASADFYLEKMEKIENLRQQCKKARGLCDSLGVFARKTQQRTAKLNDKITASRAYREIQDILNKMEKEILMI